MSVIVRKLFRHGGSYALDLPMDFVRSAGATEVILESTPERLSIRPKTELDNIESDPLFAEFINALAVDAMKHPEKLHEAKKVWDKEWDKLLKGVIVDEESLSFKVPRFLLSENSKTKRAGKSSA